MRVVSNQKIEIRANAPHRTNDNLKGLIYPGFEIEVIEEVEGQNIDGNNTWYKDLNGDFLWSGELTNADDSLIQISVSSNLPDILVNSIDVLSGSLKTPISYYHLLDISEEYKKFLSNDFIVAIIDTPVNTNIPGLKKSFDEPSVYSNLRVDHGTFMAGLIGGEDRKGITGVAPRAIMHEVPAIDNFGHTRQDLLLKGLKSLLKLSENKTLVVNASMNILTKEDIKTQMDMLCEKCIVVAAAGEDSELEFVNKRQYPSSNPNSISVGKYSKSYFESGDNTRIIKSVDVLVPEFNFVSYNRSTEMLKYMNSIGDSCSCAIVTGAIALLLGSKSCKPDVNSLRQKLREISYPISDAGNFSYLRLVQT